MKYLKIIVKQHEWKYTKSQKILKKLLYFIFPVANPDFEKVFDYVSEWLLEFEDEKNIPVREIGINKEGAVIAKMPFNDNYGYWTDNSLSYEDFIVRFETTEITQGYFESQWANL
jgi:hypothetical protein